jgi:hypothetical protein
MFAERVDAAGLQVAQAGAFDVHGGLSQSPFWRLQQSATDT